VQQVVNSIQQGITGVVRPLGARAGAIVRVDATAPVAALTFDDGPDPASTPQVLDVLEAHGAVGTFFMCGRQAARHPDLVAEVAARGHLVANHGWSHRSVVLEAPPDRRRSQWWAGELQATAAVLEPWASPFIRPPFGHTDVRACLTARRLGFDTVLWQVAARDWDGRSADVLADDVLGRLSPGAIVLFHDAMQRPRQPELASRTTSLAALELVLAGCPDWQWVSVAELLTRGPVVRRIRHEVSVPSVLPPP
jgi:peptidoglycan/xylan/chitin deacetylase (PgdA/CDA1 family)